MLPAYLDDRPDVDLEPSQPPRHRTLLVVALLFMPVLVLAIIHGCFLGVMAARHLLGKAASEEQFERVEIGMSKEQVEEVLGIGPFHDEPRPICILFKERSPPSLVVFPAYYAGAKGGVIEVQFFGDSVYAKYWHHSMPPLRGFIVLDAGNK